MKMMNLMVKKAKWVLMAMGTVMFQWERSWWYMNGGNGGGGGE